MAENREENRVPDLVLVSVSAPALALSDQMIDITWTVRNPAQAAHSYAHADQITFEGFDPRVPA